MCILYFLLVPKKEIPHRLLKEDFLSVSVAVDFLRRVKAKPVTRNVFNEIKISLVCFFFFYERGAYLYFSLQDSDVLKKRA